jgi:hypothetical protein
MTWHLVGLAEAAIPVHVVVTLGIADTPELASMSIDCQ